MKQYLPTFAELVDRQYLPTFAELVDRLSIVILKSIFISENRDAYEEEQKLIMHDIDEILEENYEGCSRRGYFGNADEGVTSIVTAKMIRAIMVVMLTNRYIWENESKARLGGAEQDKLLKLTHSINGVRNTAKNVMANELGERIDLKIDALAADLIAEYGNWNLFKK